MWQSISAAAAGATPLVDLTGGPTAATLTRVSGAVGNFSFNNAGTSGDDEALMDDVQDIGSVAATTTWRFDNLAAGNYMVFTYAWAPDNAAFLTDVSVNGGPTTFVGGAWPSGYVFPTTHAIDSVAVAAGGSITIVLTTANSFGSFNGVQLKHTPPPQPPTKFCRGDGTGDPCPCNNSGGPGRGCANASDPNGASLDFAGTSSISAADLTFLSSGAPPTAPILFAQGSTMISATSFGDGLGCIGGTLVRLKTKTSSGGMATYPSGGDAPVAVRGGVSAGDVRFYQGVYRDAHPTFCMPATFNITNGVRVPWSP
jgi:hypothetical protein